MAAFQFRRGGWHVIFPSEMGPTVMKWKSGCESETGWFRGDRRPAVRGVKDAGPGVPVDGPDGAIQRADSAGSVRVLAVFQRALPVSLFCKKPSMAAESFCHVPCGNGNPPQRIA